MTGGPGYRAGRARGLLPIIAPRAARAPHCGWRAGQKPGVPWSTRTFAGSLGLGWGLFNLIEGLIDHHLLGVHHVHPGDGQLAWDLGFLLSGALLARGGYGLIWAGRRDARPRGAVVTAQVPGGPATPSGTWQ